ncbi:MAG: NADH-quinone oxidoreductase subunit H [Candidatus Aminicenantes bacterium]|nr:NADH-quinone oxidoreductase subunit H [Candidatus Aminicenantes bacterium]
MVMGIVYALVNVLVFVLLAPFYDGVARRLTARVQSRKGPPLRQPYLDILKLLGKENVISAEGWPFRLAPLSAFASILAVIVLVPLGAKANILSHRADVITVVYLLALGGVSVLLGALASRNTFAMIGASREMMTMIMIEPVLAMTLIMTAVKVNSLGLQGAMAGVSASGFGLSTGLMLAVYLLALQAFVAKQPFDIAEAEIEVLEGPFIEYSGPNYALFKLSMMLKQMFYAFLFVSVFLPAAGTGVYPLDILIQLAAILAVFVLIAVVGSTNPRLRIDQAVRYYAVLIFLSLCAVGLALKGL